MADFIAQFGGIGLAFLGAALAVGLCCVALPEVLEWSARRLPAF